MCRVPVLVLLLLATSGAVWADDDDAAAATGVPLTGADVPEVKVLPAPPLAADDTLVLKVSPPSPPGKLTKNQELLAALTAARARQCLLEPQQLADVLLAQLGKSVNSLNENAVVALPQAAARCKGPDEIEINIPAMAAEILCDRAEYDLIIVCNTTQTIPPKQLALFFKPESIPTAPQFMMSVALHTAPGMRPACNCA